MFGLFILVFYSLLAINNSVAIDKYLFQYQDIYNSQIYVDDNAENHITNDASIRPDFFSLESIGDINSDIVFIEDFLLVNNSNFNSYMKKSMDLFLYRDKITSQSEFV